MKAQHFPAGFIHISTPPATVRPDKGLVLELEEAEVGDRGNGQDNGNG